LARAASQPRVSGERVLCIVRKVFSARLRHQAESLPEEGC